MPIKIYNTLTRTKEPLRPIEEGHVKLYVCGITSYDFCHIGHARSFLVFDMIVLPGGLPGADHLDRDPRVHTALTRTATAGHYVAAICAAPKVLASTGLLDNRKATSFPGVLDALAVPGLRYLEDAVVQDGKIITSRGPGTAMDFALTLIETLVGKAKRDQVEAALQRPGHARH